MISKRAVQISSQANVATLLDRWPQVVSVFLKHGMSCVGCSMAAFETLEDATRNYGIFTGQFLEEIEKMIGQDK